MSGEIFDSLSAFYTELWGQLDAFFDDHRWIRAYPYPSVSERNISIKTRYAVLAERLQESVLVDQISSDMKAVEGLVEVYEKEKPEPGSQWFKQADRMRDYLQTMGHRYGELALDRVRS